MNIFRKNEEKLTSSKVVCAFCKRWKPLIGISGKNGHEVDCCESCISERYEVRKR